MLEVSKDSETIKISNEAPADDRNVQPQVCVGEEDSEVCETLESSGLTYLVPKTILLEGVYADIGIKSAFSPGTTILACNQNGEECTDIGMVDESGSSEIGVVSGGGVTEITSSDPQTSEKKTTVVQGDGSLKFVNYEPADVSGTSICSVAETESPVCAPSSMDYYSQVLIPDSMKPTTLMLITLTGPEKVESDTVSSYTLVSDRPISGVWWDWGDGKSEWKEVTSCENNAIAEQKDLTTCTVYHVFTSKGFYDVRGTACTETCTSPEDESVEKASATMKYVEVEQSLRDKRIVLDPGHGGSDPGFVSPLLDADESSIVLEIAKITKEKLQDAGAIVTMTRSTDTAVNVQKVDLNGDSKIDGMDEILARTSDVNPAKHDVFISIQMLSSTQNQDYAGIPSPITDYEKYDYKRVAECYLEGTPTKDCQDMLKAASPEIPTFCTYSSRGGIIGFAYCIPSPEASGDDRINYVYYPFSDYCKSHSSSTGFARNAMLADSLFRAVKSSSGIGSGTKSIIGADWPFSGDMDIPAAAISVGYICNGGEKNAIMSSATKDRIAKGIVDGLRDYYSRS